MFVRVCECVMCAMWGLAGWSNRGKPSSWRGVSCNGKWSEQRGGSRGEGPVPLRSSAVCEKCCSYTVWWNQILWWTTWECVYVCDGSKKDDQVLQTVEKVTAYQCVCGYVCVSVSHHWMISVIWASQWATLSFLSASSLISSSSCRLEPVTFSNMLDS